MNPPHIPTLSETTPFASAADEVARIAIPLVLLAWLLIGWTVGRRIGDPRGRPRVGACLGLIFGPVGWLITALLPRSAEAEADHRLPSVRRPASPPARSVSDERPHRPPAQRPTTALTERPCALPTLAPPSVPPDVAP